MRIKSNYKDYYDFIAHQFGGGDPLCVYNRIPIPEDKCMVKLSSSELSELNIPISEQGYISVLALAGKFYTLITPENKSPDRRYHEYAPLYLPRRLYSAQDFERDNELRSRRWWRRSARSNYGRCVGERSKILDKIAKQVEAPVFIISGIAFPPNDRTSIRIESRIPVLSEYNLASILSPAQAYQDIAYYIQNTMHDSPDLRLPEIQTNKEKIEQHGFDPKQSFRNRK